MESLREKLGELRGRLGVLLTASDLDQKRKSLRELEARAIKPDFWDDAEQARGVMSEISVLQEEIAILEGLEQQISDAFSVVDEPELEQELYEAIGKINRDISRLEVSTFLSGEYDKNDAILAIHSGQGGTEAMDWAQMLFRMYVRYAQSRDWKVEVLEENSGEEAGIKSATLLVSGRWAYGYLRGESGTHRLVRQSPFNADKLRQTSFALVEVLPKIEEAPDIEIKEDDLEWQFFRASSQGGQNVQKVSTAVRVVHKPTGIIVTSQTERYQEQNRKIALSLLRAKLWLRQKIQREENLKEIKGDYRPAAWGTQIRSYVLHPYKMVKDLRTSVETGDTEGVLDGKLDEFIDAELRLLAGV
ncbi:MAG: peptide chain release factor 2 [Candidatus Blackburnbacteria bacterium]|nr:peptide chain release factor 2 [Candidatus Blackburnbacteria bacterium]